MRIIYLHQYFNTPAHPGSTRSYEMARRLVRKGHEVHVVTTQRDPKATSLHWSESMEDGIKVHWLPIPYSNAMSYADRIKAFLRFAIAASYKANALHGDLIFATSTPLTIAIPAIYAARRRRVPMVFEVRDLWPEIPIAMGALKSPLGIRVARWLERLAYRNSRAVIALSPGMSDGIVRTGYPAESVYVIPNSADVDLFRISASRGNAFRSRHQWLGDRPLVAYVGTLGRANGVGFMVELASATKALDPNIRFAIVGDGYERRQLESQARAVGVLNENLFFLGQLAKESVPDVFSAATITTSLFINLPELWHNSANKAFDAFAAAKPLAVNHKGWIAELVIKSQAGFALNADINIAAQDLVRHLRDADWIATACTASGNLADRYFNRDKLAEEFERVLIGAVDSHMHGHNVHQVVK